MVYVLLNKYSIDIEHWHVILNKCSIACTIDKYVLLNKCTIEQMYYWIMYCWINALLNKCTVDMYYWQILLNIFEKLG